MSRALIALALCASSTFAAEPWWSLQPLARPDLPKSETTGNPIDRFVRQALAAKKLTPSPEADRVTLIRRLTFDLHGLPPTPSDVDAFLNDNRTDAYEQLVKRLLASPRYGERWGRHWLDVVHYGDTHGYDKDKRRDHAWPYRDYVIKSFNDDKPYARFIREQIAGDVLYPGMAEGVIATGFVVAGPWDFVGHVELREGTVDKEKTRVIDRDDIVANTISTFMSLTAHCARCHNHKFDPIPQEDYYRLQAVFAGVERGDRTYPGPTSSERLKLELRQKELQARLADIQKKIQTLTSPELATLDVELKQVQNEIAKLPPVPAAPRSPSNGYHSNIEASPDVTKWVQVDLGKSIPIERVRLVPARPVDFPDTPGFGFPRRFLVQISDDAEFANAITVADHSGADFANPGDEPVGIRVGKSARYVRVTAKMLWKRTGDYVFALSELQVVSNGKNAAHGSSVAALDSIEAGLWSKRHLVDGFSSRAKLADVEDIVQTKREQLAGQLRSLEKKREQLIESQIGEPTRRERQALASQLAEVDAKLKTTPALPQVYGPVPRSPRPIYVLQRGEVEKPKELATPGALACVSTMEADFKLVNPNNEGERRVALANWIADARNPLTWRSMANRIWHYHFGKGLVDTPNDFGKNGSKPTHPTLLDWLACELRDTGSIKRLHEMIVTSATYRQQSTFRPEMAKIDADNRYLWRMNRLRLDAESVRDSVLAVSGKLNMQMGGPGFDLFRFKDDHSPVYDHTDFSKSDRPEAWRRTVYRFTVRSVPNPFLDCLDCADPSINTPVRNTTLTALQALALLNDPFMVKQAEYFAQRVEGIAKRPMEQIEIAYRIALSRRPTPDESSAFVDYAKQHGLANACRLLFNLNEFTFVD